MRGVDFQRLHHAYLIIGGADDVRDEVEGFFHLHGVKLKGSPDYFLFTEPLLGVGEARKIVEQSIRRAFGSKKVFFIAPEKLTHEAQNALLKTFEEPIVDTHFFLVLRNENLVLPTLRSRMATVYLDEKASEAKEAKKFLSLSIKDRLNFVKKFVDAEKNLSAFLDELLLELRSGGESARLEKVYKMRLVSDDRGVLPRLLLEHLAALL